MSTQKVVRKVDVNHDDTHNADQIQLEGLLTLNNVSHLQENFDRRLADREKVEEERERMWSLRLDHMGDLFGMRMEDLKTEVRELKQDVKEDIADIKRNVDTIGKKVDGITSKVLMGVGGVVVLAAVAQFVIPLIIHSLSGQ